MQVGAVQLEYLKRITIISAIIVVIMTLAFPHMSLHNKAGLSVLKCLEILYDATHMWLRKLNPSNLEGFQACCIEFHFSFLLRDVVALLQ